MNISWEDKITNIEVLDRAGQPSMEIILIMNLRWLGHVERMDHRRLPKQLLYLQLCEGKCYQSIRRLRFKDTKKKPEEVRGSRWTAKDRATLRNPTRPE